MSSLLGSITNAQACKYLSYLCRLHGDCRYELAEFTRASSGIDGYELQVCLYGWSFPFPVYYANGYLQILEDSSIDFKKNRELMMLDLMIDYAQTSDIMYGYGSAGASSVLMHRGCSAEEVLMWCDMNLDERHQ